MIAMTAGCVAVAVVTVGSPPPVSSAAGSFELAGLQFRTTLPTVSGVWGLAPTQETPPSGSRRPLPFGEKGSWRWNLTGGYAFQFTDSQNRLALGGVGVSYFMIDDLSFELELNGLYFDQEGENGVGANVNFLARWHAVARDRWSIYFDLGAGLLGTDERVPAVRLGEAGGTRFNFTPQAGVGLSFEVAEETRMLLGVRWHHISNARTSVNNPARDNLLIYAGVSFPF